MDGIRRKLGPKWAYRLRESITLATAEEWQLLLSVMVVSGLCLSYQPGSQSTSCQPIQSFTENNCRDDI